MPTICKFLGIIIRMYWSEHQPPHFHAIYDDYEIEVNLLIGMITGEFPAKQLKKVIEWSNVNRNELLENWELVQSGQNPKQIEPLK